MKPTLNIQQPHIVMNTQSLSIHSKSNYILATEEAITEDATKMKYLFVTWKPTYKFQSNSKKGGKSFSNSKWKLLKDFKVFSFSKQSLTPKKCSSLVGSVTSQKLSNVFKSCPKVISLEKLRFWHFCKNCLRMWEIWAK